MTYQSVAVRPSPLQRLRWALGSLLGDERTRRGREALARLDKLSAWFEYLDRTAFLSDAEALSRHGEGTAPREAQDLADRASTDLPALESGIARAYATASAERWEQLRLDVDDLESRRSRYDAARERLASLARSHAEAQRAVWLQFETCDVCRVAAVLAEEIARAPDLEGLPKPDLSAYHEAAARVSQVFPAGYRGGYDITFSPEEARRAVLALIEQAREAQSATTQYLHSAIRGYEAAMGPEETARIAAMLRDPSSVRDLKQQHPEMFPNGGYPAGGMAEMLPMMMMFMLLSNHGSAWSPVAAEAAGLPPDASGGDLLSRYDLPNGEQIAGAAALPDTRFDAPGGDSFSGAPDTSFDMHRGDVGGGGFDGGGFGDL